MCTYAYMYMCIFESMHLCIYASMHECIYASMHLCIYAPAAARRGKRDMTNIGPNIKQSRQTNTEMCLKSLNIVSNIIQTSITLVQKSTKMGPKIDQNRSQGPLGELWMPSSPKDGSKSQHRLQNLVRWTPLDVEVGGQNPPKIGPKLIQNVLLF